MIMNTTETTTLKTATRLLSPEQRDILTRLASKVGGDDERDAILRALDIDAALGTTAGILLSDGSYGDVNDATVYSAASAREHDFDGEDELYEALETGEVTPLLVITRPEDDASAVRDRALHPWVVIEGGIAHEHSDGLVLLQADVFGDDVLSEATYEEVERLLANAKLVGHTDVVKRAERWLEEHADLKSGG